MKVLIVDDHAVVRRGVIQILTDAFPRIKIGEADSGKAALAAVAKESWDIVILDINLPDRKGLEVLRAIKSEYPLVAVMILSLHPEEQYALRALKSGASAYLTKQSAPEELVAAIKHVLKGRIYVSASLAEHLAGTLSKDQTADPAHRLLSDREFDVLCRLAQGHSVKDIGLQLSLSMKTVSTYRSRLLDKLHLNSTADLIRYALDHHLIV
ncbi:MAG TPA: response regulator transcription factor [Nitrospiraceae bacterium]|jgi:DNA-binding NarL/FixJ family response regulator